jgi:hypothetical protein
LGGIGAACAVPDSRTWNLKVFAGTIDREVGVWITGLVGTWELDKRTWGTITTTRDLNLETRHEVFRLVNMGTVDTNMLKTDEIFAARGADWDLSCDIPFIIADPGVRLKVTTTSKTVMIDLEPVSRSIISLDIISWSS